MITYNEWQHGKRYSVQQNGNLMVRRERGVDLGTVRVFLHNNKVFYDTPVKYYAERDFPSIIPFRAPVVWWRRISECR
jgi:hypothetical protein